MKYFDKGVTIDKFAREQIRRVAEMPFIYPHVAVMPDAHAGQGATIGSVIPSQGAIIPAAVGVDLGCGMTALKTSLQAYALPDSLDAMRADIEAAIPHGRTDNGGVSDKGSHSVADFKDLISRGYHPLIDNLKDILNEHSLLSKWTLERAFRQMGTLGTGNHFIEICLDEGNHVWVMLHSGSRGIGNAIGNYFINLAKEDMQRWFINLPDKDLAYIPEGSAVFNSYLWAVNWTQDFAYINRLTMLREVAKVLAKYIPGAYITQEKAINCHHNYVSRERHYGKHVWVTRKGAISAQQDELGIIPGSMGTKSYIVRGKGNRESLMSCSHGAGRCMSRTQARDRITPEEHQAAIAHVCARQDTIDESPGAYKDIDAVMAAQTELVDIVHTLKAVLCVKG